jgi:lipopolysaccharide export LptBFGC system permease protein LptF
VRILSVHLVREFATSSAAVLAGLLVTWFAGDSLRRLDDFGQDGRDALREVVLVATEMLPYAVPMACLGGAVWTLSRAVRFRELVAIRSGGIPLRRALAPLLAAAAVVAVGLGLFFDRVVIPARIALAREDAEPNRPKELAGRYWMAHDPWVFSAGSYDAANRALRDVVMFELDAEGRVIGRIDAGEARNVQGEVWQLRDARVRSFGATGGIGTEHHADLELSLGVSGEQYERVRADPGRLTLHRIARAMRKASPEENSALAAAFHGRLLEPLSVLIVVLFAIPLAVGAGDSLARALVRSLALATAFWLCWTVALFTAHLPGVPPFAPLWALVLTALALGAWRYQKISE